MANLKMTGGDFVSENSLVVPCCAAVSEHAMRIVFDQAYI